MKKTEYVKIIKNQGNSSANITQQALTNCKLLE